MPITRRDFVQQAGLALASGLVADGCRSIHGKPPATTPGSVAGVACENSPKFRNWSQTIELRPRQFCKPTSESEVVALVKHAIDTGTHVRTQGSRHSFSQLLVTGDTLVTLEDMKGPISVSGHRVTVPAGIRIEDLVDELKKRGLGMKNLGSIMKQSIAGAFSTGTHGSGITFGAIPTQVVGVKLVDGERNVRTVTDDPSHKDDLAAARINVGLLGIITEVTLECVDFYKLDYAAYVTNFDEIVANINQLVAENDRVVVWWLLMSDDKDKRDTCILITKNSVDHPVSSVLPQPEGTISQCDPLSKDLSLLLAMIGKTPKKGFKQINRCRDDYYKVLTLPLLPVFHRECEYAIPAGSAVTALTKMRDIVDEGDLTLSLPVELRWVAQDNVLLSPCYNGPVCYIGASTLLNSTEVFERFEPLMKSLGGRPHWGKCYTLTQDEVAKMYPTTYNTFQKVRDKYDTNRVFTNSLLSELIP
jgi:L-gulono-1,4-lactone dehydrogenase